MTAGNEAERPNAATMQCAFRTSTLPGAETICAAPSNRSWARCRVCSGVLFARCDAHGGAVEVTRLRRDHEEGCAAVHQCCRRCLAVVVDREAGEEICPDCS